MKASLFLIAALVLSASDAEAKDSKDAVTRCTEAAESGQRLRASGQLRAASKQITTCISPECPAAVRRHCAKWREELTDTTPSIVFRVVDGVSGADVQAGKILVDGEVVAETLDGRAVSVDPGAHHVVWTTGTDHVEQDLVVREGEHNRMVVLTQNATTAAPSPPPPPPAQPRSTWPWVIGGAGVTVGVVGGVFWFLGANTHSDLASTCAKTSSCRDADVSRGKTELVVGDVLIGLSAVAIATAVVWLMTRGGSSSPPQTTAVR